METNLQENAPLTEVGVGTPGGAPRLRRHRQSVGVTTKGEFLLECFAMTGRQIAFTAVVGG